MEKDDRQLLSESTTVDELGWKPYNAGQADDRDKSVARKVTSKVNMAGVCALSRRLMAIERARMLGRKPVDVQAQALELEARRWTERGAKVKQALRGAT